MTETYSSDDYEPDEILESLGADRAYHLEKAEHITAELREKVRDAHAAGVSESEIARIAGVSRLTVRSWLGK